MMRKKYTGAFLIFIVLILFFSCSKDRMLPEVAIIVGDNVEYKNGGTYKLSVGYQLKENDTIIVPENAKVKLSFNNEVLYINSKSNIRIGAVIKQNGNYRLTFNLLDGELFFSQKQNGKADSYLFVTQNITATASVTDLNIKYDKNSSELIIIPLSGSVFITSQNSGERMIGSCNRFFSNGAEKSDNESIRETDITWLMDWVGKSIIDEAISKSNCTIKKIAVRNLPPEWTRLPSGTYMAGESNVDTVEAIDPENRQITYELLSGPEGMTIDQISGEISFKPSSEGRVNITVRATDSDLQSSVLDYSINISTELTVSLSAPHMITPGKIFSIRASLPQNAKKKLNDFTYRFDCNGDGIFDYPGSGMFGSESSVNKCSILKEGIYQLRVEIKNSEGNTAVSSRKVIVNQSPVAVLKITPLIGTTKTEFLLDAGASSDSHDSLSDLMVRFDINNDGRWDIPSSSGFLNEKRANCSWNEPGSFKVIVQVIDKQGMADTASIVVRVSNGLHIDYVTCPDTIHVGDTTRIECKISPSEFPIVAYSWSFDSDTGLEVSTNKPVCNHVFKNAGEVMIRCRVVDEKGLCATQQKKVIIVNSTCKIDAGGPYNASIDTSIFLEGIARDSDSKIIEYSWDFNNDGEADWTSKQASKVSYTFQRSGRKTLFFSVLTDDGRKVTDSAIVLIKNEPPIADAGEDIVSRSGKKVKLNGTGKDPEGKILSYHWDFDNDGKFDWSSNENGNTEREFMSYTTAVFSIIDSDSCRSNDSIRIIICPDGMQMIEKGKYCIDTYEYPNKKDTEPETNVTYDQALKICQQQEKRLCSAQEWTLACRDQQEKFIYPYGRNFIKERCNTLGNPVLKNKVGASGTFYDCHGNAGVYDMSGNAAEWTNAENGESYVYGGSWQSGENSSTCDSKLQLQGGGKYFYVGFRCCK